jgi:hypothetical protein
MPRWQLPEEPDTAWHRGARIVLCSLLAMAYLLVVVAWFLGAVKLSFGIAVMFGYSLFMGIPAICYLVRPGKGKTLVISAICMLLALACPPLIIIVPCAIKGVAMWRATHPDAQVDWRVIARCLVLICYPALCWLLFWLIHVVVVACDSCAVTAPLWQCIYCRDIGAAVNIGAVGLALVVAALICRATRGLWPLRETGDGPAETGVPDP